MVLRDSVISKVVIASSFIHMDIWDAIEIASENCINIAITKTPQSAEECLAFKVFVRRINIDELKGSAVLFEFGRKDPAFRVSIMTENLNRAPRMEK